MKTLVSESVKTRICRKSRIVVLSFVAMASTAFVPAAAIGGEPGGAAALQTLAPPPGVKVLAQLPLQGPSATRMFTQWEHGRNYLYVEHRGEQITTVDITNKSKLQLVGHQPEPVTAPHYEPADGGPIEVVSQNAVNAGVDNGKSKSFLTVLQADDDRDAQLLRFFGYDSSNLVDRDRRLIFFASPTQLLVLEDNRWDGMDYITN